jgi:hypothetical protein
LTPTRQGWGSRGQPAERLFVGASPFSGGTEFVGTAPHLAPQAAGPTSKDLLPGYARVSKGDDQVNILQGVHSEPPAFDAFLRRSRLVSIGRRPELHRTLDQLREATPSRGLSP